MIISSSRLFLSFLPSLPTYSVISSLFSPVFIAISRKRSSSSDVRGSVELKRANLLTIPTLKAVERWYNAFRWNKRYSPSEEDVFTCGVILLFISLTYFKLGDADESWASFSRAAEIISKKKPQFLIPGVGTHLYDFAWRELWSAAGWLLPGKTL